MFGVGYLFEINGGRMREKNGVVKKRREDGLLLRWLWRMQNGYVARGRVPIPSQDLIPHREKNCEMKKRKEGGSLCIWSGA